MMRSENLEGSQSAGRRVWRKYKYMMTLTVPLSVWISFQSEGWMAFASLAFVFVALPSLELFLPSSNSNLAEAEAELASKDVVYDGLLWGMVLVQYGFLLYFLWSLWSGQRAIWSFDWWGMVLSMGLLCSVLGINIGHELGHRTDQFSQMLAKAMLVTVLYTHFFIEHNQGHHRNVATSEDPATARKNEWFQTFYFRALILAWWSGWKLESKRMRRKGLSTFHYSNVFIQLQILQWSLLAGVAVFLGWEVALAWFIAGMFGGFLLEVVNYIEHYGLLRERVNEHRYERVSPQHSWNSDHVIGRMMLFELSRHSDHHHQPAKPFRLLDSMEGAPQLPTGYPGMMILCLFPPLFFAIMNPRLERRSSQTTGG